MTRHRSLNLMLYLLVPVMVMTISVALGRYPIGLKDIFILLALKIRGESIESLRTINTVVFNVRLPRILGAMVVGSSLSLSGTVYQSTFRNPMVSPGILGVANGAGFGAALGILLSFGFAGVQFAAFLFGLAAVGITCFISGLSEKSGGSLLTLVLVGMVISTIFSSLISLIKYTADPDDKLPAITFWLMGSLSTVTLKEVLFTFIPVTAGSIPLILLRWKLNILTFGEEEAAAMGVNTRIMRMIIIFCSTVITAAAISVSGIVGWVGLIIPHICRMILGPDHKSLVPLSMAAGAVYLMIVDDVARSVSRFEIPLGIITSLIGAPFFLYLIFRKKGAWQ